MAVLEFNRMAGVDPSSSYKNRPFANKSQTIHLFSWNRGVFSLTGRGLSCKLQSAKLCVMPIGMDEGIMGTGLDNPPVSHHMDGIRIADRRQAMGNDQSGAMAHQGIQSELNQLL